MSAPPLPCLHDVAMTHKNYQEWTARLDALWSAVDCERHRMEMQTLLQLIERYEQTPNNTDRRTP